MISDRRSRSPSVGGWAGTISAPVGPPADPGAARGVVSGTGRFTRGHRQYVGPPAGAIPGHPRGPCAPTTLRRSVPRRPRSDDGPADAAGPAKVHGGEV